MTTIFEALRESHEIQRDLAEKLLQTSGDTPERRELFKQLKMNCLPMKLRKTVILYSLDDD